jgi:hypothetical protein
LSPIENVVTPSGFAVRWKVMSSGWTPSLPRFHLQSWNGSSRWLVERPSRSRKTPVAVPRAGNADERIDLGGRP